MPSPHARQAVSGALGTLGPTGDPRLPKLVKWFGLTRREPLSRCLMLGDWVVISIPGRTGGRMRRSHTWSEWQDGAECQVKTPGRQGGHAGLERKSQSRGSSVEGVPCGFQATLDQFCASAPSVTSETGPEAGLKVPSGQPRSGMWPVSSPGFWLQRGRCEKRKRC